MGKKRANGEGSGIWITKNGKKCYRIAITIDTDPLTGAPKRKYFYGKTQSEAKAKEKEYLEMSSKASDTSKLGAFMHNWLWEIKRNSIKPSTFERWEGIYRMYINPNKALRDKKLVDIDTIYLQKVTNEMLKDHNLSKVKNVNKLISTCMNYAITINKVKSNPTKGIVYPTDYSVEQKKDNYIEESKQKILINEIKSFDTEPVILIGLLCGMRVGEILALSEEDFNFDTKLINVNKSIKRVWTGTFTKEDKKIYEYAITKPKTPSSIRKVPMPDIIIPMVTKCIEINKTNKKKLGKDYFDIGLVFCRENGTCIDTKKPNRQLKSALQKADIPADICFHSLRHIFITNCLSKDINWNTVKRWAGHEDINMTMNVYAEINHDKNKKDYEKINNMFI